MGAKKIYNRSQARKNLPSLINEVKDGGDLVYISERGVKQAVLISYKEYKKVFGKKKKQSESLLSIAGMWKDRPDMNESANWVNKQRENSVRKFK